MTFILNTEKNSVRDDGYNIRRTFLCFETKKDKKFQKLKKTRNVVPDVVFFVLTSVKTVFVAMGTSCGAPSFVTNSLWPRSYNLDLFVCFSFWPSHRVIK